MYHTMYYFHCSFYIFIKNITCKWEVSKHPTEQLVTRYEVTASNSHFLDVSISLPLLCAALMAYSCKRDTFLMFYWSFNTQLCPLTLGQYYNIKLAWSGNW